MDSHKNFAYSSLATPPSGTGGTSLVVQTGHGTLFPTVPFNATIWPAGLSPLASNAEIVRVTNISTDTFTITRAQEGSTARTWTANSQIAATITKKVLTDIEYGAHGVINVKDPTYGAVGDGTTDDTTAIQAAVTAHNAAGGGLFYVPDGTYKITASAGTFTVPTILCGAGQSATIIKPNTGAATVKVFVATTNDFHVRDLTLDGSANTSTLTGNQYAFFSGDGSTKYYRHSYQNVRVVDFIASTDISPLYSTPLAAHAIYIDDVDDVAVLGCTLEDTLGAGVFLRDCVRVQISGNTFRHNYWYPVNLESGITNYVIAANRFDEDFAEGVYWGGGINVVSQIGESLCKRGRITGNDFSGKYSYGGVVRLQSAWDVEVDNNTFHDFTVGSELPTATQTMTAIRVVTRGTSTAAQSGPSQNVRIHHNTIDAPTDHADMAQRQAIYIDNQFQTARTPIKGVWVEDNTIRSASSSDYWQNGVIFHGQSGGMEDVHVTRNRIEVYLHASSLGSGGIGFVATDADGLIDRVYLGANTIIEKGTANSSVYVGISIGAYTDNVVNDAPNFLSNLYYGVRTLTNAGPTLIDLHDQIFDGITNTALLAGVALSQAKSLGQSATSTQLNALSDPLNALASGFKFAGKMVWNSTVGYPVFSVGAAAASVWVDATGATVNTPV